MIFYADGLRDAKAIAAEHEAKVKTDESDGATFETLVRRWAKDNPTNIRAATMRTYEANLTNHVLPTLGRVRLHDLRKTDFAQLRLHHEQQKKLSASTINQCLAACRTACKYAVEGLGWLDTNPAAVARSRMAKKTPEATDPKDLLVVLEHIDGKEKAALKTMVVMAALTGARVSELCGLQWSDVEVAVDKQGAVTGGGVKIAWMVDRYGTRQETKTHTSRFVPLGADAVGWLLRWREMQLATAREKTGVPVRSVKPGWFVWPSDGSFDAPSHVGGWSHLLKKECDAAGLPGKVKLHGLRHLAATEMVNQGHAPTAVSGVLGHARTSMTLDVYAAPVRSDAIEATAGLAKALKIKS